MSKKVLSVLLALVMVLTFSVGTLAGNDRLLTSAATQSGDIVILHTNDAHCEVGGYAKVAALKAELSKTAKGVALVDAGDFSQGGVLGTLSQGEYLVDIMNKVGYDVVTVGNHEFDYGMAQCLKNLNALNAKVVSCNFADLKAGKTVFDAYTMQTYGDKKVAFVGITTPEAFTKSTPAYFQDENGNYIYGLAEGNNGADLYSAVQKSVDAAKAAGADYVVALGHCGIDDQSKPWTSREIIANTTGINAFIDGHSHSEIVNESVADKDGKAVVLAQTGTKFAAIGKLTIKADGTIVSELVKDYTGSDTAVAAYVADIQAKNEATLQKVVAKSSVTLTIKNADGTRAVRSQETNLGDLCADAYRILSGADIGWVNGGGIRADIASGEVTYEEIIAVHPFGNALCVVEATGQEIVDALEMSARSCPDENGGFLQVSGLKYTVDTTVASTVKLDDKKSFVSVEGARRVQDVLVLDSKTGQYAPIDLAKTYTLASHDYMLKNGGDGINMFTDNKLLKDSVMLDNQVLINYIVKYLNGAVGYQYSLPQGRITVTAHFSDATSANWFFAPVKYCYENSLVKGRTETAFAPAANMTVAEYLTALYRMGQGMGAQYPEKATTGANWMEAASYMVDGELTVAELNTPITREEMAYYGATFLKSVAGSAYDIAVDPARTAVFTDEAQVSAEYLESVKFFYSVGGISGYPDGSYRPSGTATRGEVAQIFYNMMEKVQLVEKAAVAAD